MQQDVGDKIYIKPKKIEEGDKEPLDDITNKMQQVFGVSNVPVSHRAMPSSSPKDRSRLIDSVCQLARMDRKDKEYE